MAYDYDTIIFAVFSVLSSLLYITAKTYKFVTGKTLFLREQKVKERARQISEQLQYLEQTFRKPDVERTTSQDSVNTDPSVAE